MEYTCDLLICSVLTNKVTMLKLLYIFLWNLFNKKDTHNTHTHKGERGRGRPSAVMELSVACIDNFIYDIEGRDQLYVVILNT